MPEDVWHKTAITKKIKGRNVKDEREAEANKDATVDQWIANRERQLAAVAVKKKSRKRKRR